MTPALTLLLSPALTLALAVAIRLIAGPERGSHWSGLAVPISFLVAWAIVVRPDWAPIDDVVRIGHIAFGALLLGAVLDTFDPKRLWAAVAVGVFVLICTWASVTGSLTFRVVAAGELLAIVVLATLAFLAIARFDAMRERAASAPLILTVTAWGVAGIAAIAGDDTLAATGVILGLSVAVFAVLQLVLGLKIGDSVILPAAAVILAMTWALAQRAPDVRLALLLLPLVLFAEPTAQRVPLPKARISAILYPLILMALAATPLVLGALLAFVTAGS